MSSLGTAWIDELAKAHLAAAKRGVWNGQGPTPYFDSCGRFHPFAGVVSIFTRDVGYHSSGWWKNPDFERCLHLSLSFVDPLTKQPRPRDQKLSSEIIRRIFGGSKKLLWCEPPYSTEGKRSDVWHYRLFCDAGWNPIKPRGEVYSKELTEAGWLSFSDARERWLKEREAVLERVQNGR